MLSIPYLSAANCGAVFGSPRSHFSGQNPLPWPWHASEWITGGVSQMHGMEQNMWVKKWKNWKSGVCFSSHRILELEVIQ